jgi:hypothetical protein
MTAEDIRALMATDLELLALAQELRKRFDAKLVWLKVGKVEFGKWIPTTQPRSNS